MTIFLVSGKWSIVSKHIAIDAVDVKTNPCGKIGNSDNSSIGQSSVGGSLIDAHGSFVAHSLLISFTLHRVHRSIVARLFGIDSARSEQKKTTIFVVVVRRLVIHRSLTSAIDSYIYGQKKIPDCWSGIVGCSLVVYLFIFVIRACFFT